MSVLFPVLGIIVDFTQNRTRMLYTYMALSMVSLLGMTILFTGYVWLIASFFFAVVT